MTNYPPILRPAMELIEAQAALISNLNITIASLVKRVNQLSSDMGYPAIDYVTDIPANDIAPKVTAIENSTATAEIVSPTDEADAKSKTVDRPDGTRRIYCSAPEPAGNGYAFYSDTLTPVASLFILDLDDNDGIFSIAPETDLRQLGFENLLKPIVECDVWPDDSISRKLITIQPGSLKYNSTEDMWEINQKAIIKFIQQ